MVNQNIVSKKTFTYNFCLQCFTRVLQRILQKSLTSLVCLRVDIELSFTKMVPYPANCTLVLCKEISTWYCKKGILSLCIKLPSKELSHFIAVISYEIMVIAFSTFFSHILSFLSIFLVLLWKLRFQKISEHLYPSSYTNV